MSFYFPLGLLGLIGIPVLIIIYIIKSKYTEQTIASTYLWELSEKFLKKRKPISKLTGIITLILQILAVTAAALLIAHPVFTIPASANDFYFILDGSASMNMVSDSSTRFEKARSEISEIIDGSRGGSSYTLVLASDATGVAFEGVTDKEQAKVYLNALNAGWTAADCSSAVRFAQEYFDYNPSAEVYLVTDKEYEVENITLVNVAAGEENYAFTDYGYSFVRGGVESTGNVISYAADCTVTVEMLLFKNLDEEPQKVAESRIELKQGEPAEFVLFGENRDFAALQLKIATDDAMAEDNSVILYDEAKAQQRKVLVVSGDNDTAYIKNAIEEAGQASIDVITGSRYSDSAPTGYGMYVFNGYAPESLPQNAAVWLINAIDGSGSGSGITYRDMQVPRDDSGANSYYVPTYTRNTTALAKLLTQDLLKRDIAIRQYAKYGVPRSFTSVLEVGGDPVICAGLNGNGDRQVVFAFKIGDSSLGMTEDFLILVRNLMNYSFPSVIDETVYNCGDVMNVNVVPGCEDIIITSPSDKTTTLDIAGADICEVQLNETGTYTITVKTAGNEDTVMYAYACVPEAESRNEAGGSLMLSGTKEYNYSDGYYDKLLAFFIVLAVLLLADWGVYCYEQYQLR